MDNPASVGPVARFVPDRRFTAGAAVGTVVAAIAAAVTGDAAGRLLWLLAAVLLLAYTVTDLVFSPRVEASLAGLTIRSPLTRVAVPWAEVESVRPDTRARWGLRSTTLEIDAGATLVVLSRRALGRDPAEAAELILAFRPAGS